MPRLECDRCGLSYHSATLPHYLLSASGASCPRCGAALTRGAGDARSYRRPEPGPASEHHRLAVARSLDRARQAAAEKDYPGALSWLATIEAIDGDLPPDVEARRRAWAARAREATTDR